jgi:type I restriction enzyme S subunit
VSSLQLLVKTAQTQEVPYATVGELAEVGTGRSDRNHEKPGGLYPLYVRSKEVLQTDTYEFDENAIVIPGEGGVGDIFHYVEGKYALHQRAYRISFKSPSVVTKFAYYYFQQRFKSYIAVKAVSATVASIRRPMITDFRIPVPPIELQNEIVGILDKFYQLEAELEAELEARKKQFGYYLSQKFSFKDRPDIWREMSTVAEVRSGWGFPNSSQGATDGEFPFYKVSDMNLPMNKTKMHDANNYVDQAVAKSLGVKPAPPGTVIFPKIGAAVGTNKKRILTKFSAYDNNVMGLVPGALIDSRFLYYWMLTVDLFTLANHSGAVPSIRKSEMETLLVPVPALDEQREIAEVMFNLDELVNSLTIGLPAELNARRTQYEYYRNQLLTFKDA